jgi:hypothetical protein
MEANLECGILIRGGPQPRGSRSRHPAPNERRSSASVTAVFFPLFEGDVPTRHSVGWSPPMPTDAWSAARARLAPVTACAIRLFVGGGQAMQWAGVAVLHWRGGHHKNLLG